LTSPAPNLLRMGQPITVTMRAGSRPDLRFFEANRSITGMAIEMYNTADTATGDRPPDVLARRLFDLGVTKVTVYSNVATVDAPAAAWPELEAKVAHTIEHLFEFYGDDAGWSFAARGMEAPVSKVE
jgi:Scaffold protein Nfu/NifU N terminal